jgi:hypothetical protein
MMSRLFYVSDFLKEGISDSQAIKDCLNSAKSCDERTIIFDKKDYYIDAAITLPSDTTVIIDGVMIKQNDFVHDNVFRADNMETDPDNPYGYPLSIKAAKDIKIIGKNDALIEGPEKHTSFWHPHFNEEQLAIGDYWGWRGFQMLISRCENFEIRDITFKKVKSWTISADRSKNLHFSDLRFYSTVKNGDGLNIRAGCSNVVIENISGETTDDLIAINSATDVNLVFPFKQYVFPLIPSNICKDEESIEDRYITDVSVRNVYTSGVSGVALLSRHGNKIKNVCIENVIDTHTGPFIHPLYPNATNLKLVYSYAGYFGETYTPGDISGVRISNAHSRFFKTTVFFGDVVHDVCIENVTQQRSDGELITLHEQQDLKEIKVFCKNDTNNSGFTAKSI